MTAIAPPQDLPPPTPEEAATQAPPPAPAADPNLVEAVVGAVGAVKFMDHSFRKLYLYHLERAAKVGDEIDRKIHLFLGRKEPEDARPLPPFDFEAVRELVDAEPTPDLTTEIIAAFGGDYADLGLAAVQVAERVQKYLRQKMPRRIHQSIAGPVQQLPGHSDVARFRRLWNLACDPLSILDDLNEYAVSRDMVQGLRDMYPLTWARIDQGITDQLLRKKSAQPNYQLSIRKENLLRVLSQKEDSASKAMGIAIQGIHRAAAEAMAQKQAPAPRPGKKGGGVSEASLSERISS